MFPKMMAISTALVILEINIISNFIPKYWLKLANSDGYF